MQDAQRHVQIAKIAGPGHQLSTVPLIHTLAFLAGFQALQS